MSSANQHDVDIIIPTRNRGALIATTIHSILTISSPKFNLWIVDQSDDDQTQTAVADHFTSDSRLHYLRTDTIGSNRARSIGASLGSAPIILFTDDDCRVDPNWVDAMHREFLNSPDAWAVFGRVLEDDQYKPEIPPSIAPVNTGGIKMALKDDMVRRVYKGNRLNLGFGHGANMGVRRTCLEKIGGFDNMLGAGGEFLSWPERDLGYRILSRGGQIVYTPAATIYHRHWRGWQEVHRTNKNYAYGAGAAIAKYWRCGDRSGALYLFVEWLLDQGLRQVLSGIFKWRSRQKCQVGLSHMIYPWQGLFESLKYPVDKDKVVYQIHTHPTTQPSQSTNIR